MTSEPLDLRKINDDHARFGAGSECRARCPEPWPCLLYRVTDQALTADYKHMVEVQELNDDLFDRDGLEDRDSLRAWRNAALTLHEPYATHDNEDRDVTACSHCSVMRLVYYPCPTVKALGGDV